MDTSSAARRVSAFVLVAGAHGMALFGLLVLSTRLIEPGADGDSLLVVLLPPLESQHAAALLARRRAASQRAPVLEAAPSGAPISVAPPDNSAGIIDWAAEAASAASRSAERNEAAARRARAFGIPPPSPMFAPAAPRKPGIAWDYAATHRVEALPGGVTVINLNEHCAIAFLWVLPMFGCSLGKIPARGDLFDHMHDEADSGAAR